MVLIPTSAAQRSFGHVAAFATPVPNRCIRTTVLLMNDRQGPPAPLSLIKDRPSLHSRASRGQSPELERTPNHRPEVLRTNPRED